MLDILESSQVHRCNNRIYDRNEDGDFNITDNTNLVAELYIRKQSSYSENRIFPYITMGDLRIDLIQRVRKLARGQRPDHPWAELDDMELLKSARLFHKDYLSGKHGFTLAAVLLFGNDDVILNVLPHHKTDALLRVDNRDRYDDRDDIRTNLIERDRVYTENANKPHGHRQIDPANFTPFPKNPVIARVFKEMGRADELGSGAIKS